MKKLNFAVDVAMHRQLKIIAAMNGVSIAELARAALAASIQRTPGNPPRAMPPSPLVTR